MKIELKAIKHFPSMSEETECFNANVYVDGKKVAYAENRGYGGNTDIKTIKGCESIVAKAEEYCKTLTSIEGMGGMKLEIDLEFHVELLLEQHLKAKDKKKLEKDFLKGIIYKDSSGIEKIIQWKGHTIETLLKHPQGLKMAKKTIDGIKAKGGTVLNTNLPKEIL